MKKTLSIVLAVIMLLCMIPTFTVFAAEHDFTTIDSAEEFAAFTKAVNAETYVPANNTTVKVTADLDMKDIKDFQPINKMYFRLDFDGHTVSNLVVTTAGFDRNTGILAHNAYNDGGILNVKLYNCELNATTKEANTRIGGVLGFAKWSLVTNATLENVTINATCDSVMHLGGVMGLLTGGSGWFRDNAKDSSYNLKNVVINTNASNVGAVIGSIENDPIVNFTEIVAENLTVNHTNENFNTSAITYKGAEWALNTSNISFATEPVIQITTTATGYVDPTVPEVDPIPVGTRLSYTAEAVADAQARTKHWNQGDLNGTIDVKIVDGKGVNGTDAIEIVRHYTGNQGRFEFILNIENGGKLGDNKYLVVWADFTNIDFAKACFGLATDGNVTQAYRTDDNYVSSDLPFYYLADGATDWETLKHGGDQCFGTQQGSSVKGKKGYFAFPVADFAMDVERKEKNCELITSDANVTGVYIFANTDVYPEVAFYIGDIQLIDDYKNVKAPELPVEPDPTPDPVPTGDMTVAFVFAALVSLAAVTVIAKKKVTE